jgi:hypothetical protein
MWIQAIDVEKESTTNQTRQIMSVSAIETAIATAKAALARADALEEEGKILLAKRDRAEAARAIHALGVWEMIGREYYYTTNLDALEKLWV